MSKIYEIRKRQGLSRVELSRQSEVPLRTIENWESGARKPRDVYQLRKIAKELQVTIEELIEDE